MKTISIVEKLSQFSDHWHPRIIGKLNGQHVKLAKIKGDFIWHSHEEEDELFYVLKGTLLMEFRDKIERVAAGEMIIIPKGVEHLPRTENGEEVHIMLFEPISTINTGGEESDKTHKNLELI